MGAGSRKVAAPQGALPFRELTLVGKGPSGPQAQAPGTVPGACERSQHSLVGPPPAPAAARGEDADWDFVAGPFPRERLGVQVDASRPLLTQLKQLNLPPTIPAPTLPRPLHAAPLPPPPLPRLMGSECQRVKRRPPDTRPRRGPAGKSDLQASHGVPPVKG